MRRRRTVTWLIATACAGTVAVLAFARPQVRFPVEALDGTVALIALIYNLIAKAHGLRKGRRDTLQANVHGTDRHGRPPRVAAANPVEMGIREAIPLTSTPRPTSLNRFLPTYVSRDKDYELDEALGRGGLVIVQGRSLSGLTRMVYEAIERCSRSMTLIIPANDRSALSTIHKKMGDIVRNAVIFLDPLEEHVNSGGFNTHILDALCPPGRADVVIVATLTPGPEPSQALEHVRRRATIIHVAQHLTPTEHAAALRTSQKDPRVGQALAQRNEPFFQYLVSGPAVFDRLTQAYEGAQRTGSAVVFAALECRRLGMAFPLTSDVLYVLHILYLERPTDRAAFDEALRWATREVLGTAACLMPASSNGYEPLPYLVEYSSCLLPEAPRGAILAKLLQYATPADAHMLGTAAFRTGRFDVAESALLLRLSRHPDDSWAAYLLGLILWEDDRANEALPRFLIAARKSNAHASYLIARIYVSTGERNEARDWFRVAAHGGHLDAKYWLGLLLHEDERSKPANSSNGELWLRDAASHGHPEALQALHKMFRERDDIDGMIEIDKLFAAETGLTRLACRGSAPRLDEYEEFLRSAVREGNTEAMNLLGVLLDRTGRALEASQYFDWAGEQGNYAAAKNVTRSARSVETQCIDNITHADKHAS